MTRVQSGALRLFNVFGISVYLHWSWAVVAGIELYARQNAYQSQAWNIAEYLTLFVIVLLHEFGHALACRSVGGKAERILLWPLGGVAYVNPPPRAGAMLWSIAAGPLVNVVLLLLLIAVIVGLGLSMGLTGMRALPDVDQFLMMLLLINIGLLAFNLLPIYPLDGGQMLRAVLWFFVGPRRSLQVASGIGLIGALGGLVLAIALQSVWLIILALFAASQSWAGLRMARGQLELAKAPRRTDVRCPACGEAPPAGMLWNCPCGARFDTFLQGAVCPQCGRTFEQTSCVFCNQANPMSLWRVPVIGGPRFDEYGRG